MTQAPVLYAGDSSLQSAAAYLAGLLHSWNIEFDYLPTSRAASAKDIATPRKLFIFSDYPAQGLSDALTREVLAQVEAGAGLIMLGGWESYHGVGGNWQASALAHALPVEIAATDDRVNCDQSALVAQVTSHPVIDGLPWDERPPSVGGFNRFRVRPGAQLLLELQRFRVHRRKGEWSFDEDEKVPLFVVGQHGKGRTAALATDVAPHWVGGLVDWGDKRVHAHYPESHEIEVGNLYAQLFEQMVRWAGQL